jgi:hypothetical protein
MPPNEMTPSGMEPQGDAAVPATEQMPQEQQPAFNGEGGPNPIPNNKIMGGRRSVRNYGYYNSRRSRNNHRNY